MTDSSLKSALFISHQGFTDIINTLGLLNYFYCQNKWSDIHVLIRDDAKDCLDYFVKDKPNIYIHSASLDQINTHLESEKTEDVHEMLKNIMSLDEYDTLIIGCNDVHNLNEYKNRWSYETNFVRQFYNCYNINYNARITHFSFTRDLNAEETQYKRFVDKYGDNYSITHLISANEARTTQNCPLIEINQYSSIFFDCIKILENAKELHLLDSIWAALVYCIQGRYNLFENKRIVIYTKRGHVYMFTDPVQIPNIEIV